MSDKNCYSTIQGFDGIFLNFDTPQDVELFVYEAKSSTRFLDNNGKAIKIDQNKKIKEAEKDLQSHPSDVKLSQIESIKSRIIKKDNISKTTLSDAQMKKLVLQNNKILDGQPENAIISVGHTATTIDAHVNAFNNQKNICFELSYDNFAQIYSYLEALC